VSHFLSLLCMVVLRILEIRICCGTVSKALLMSIAVNVVLRGNCLVLKPSMMSCLRVERCVVS